jgi:hypothetical protein
MWEPDEVPEEEPMHPEILRELTSQRGREMRDRAHRTMLARTASRIRRARRRGPAGLGDATEFVAPAIPDYVDGSFGVPPADDKAAGQADRTGRVPTTGRVA